MGDQPESSPQAAYLRALGHEDAARALEAADSLVPKPPAAGEPQKPEPPRDPREAEGRVLLDALNAQTAGGGWLPGGSLLDRAA